MAKKTSSKQRSSPDDYGGAQIVGVEEVAKGVGVLLPYHEVLNLMDALHRFLSDKRNNPYESASENSAAVLQVDLTAARVTLHAGTWKPTYARRGRAAKVLRLESRRSA